MKTDTFKTEYSEKFIPLMSEEIQTIKTKRTKTLLGMCVFFVFWYSVLYFIIGKAPDMGFKIFGLVFAVFPFIIVAMLLWNAHRDIKFGQKKIIRGRIDDKKSHTSSSGTGKNRSTTTYNYFIMSGQEISVSSVHYNNFQTGDIIEMEMLPKSGEVLKVTELYSNTERGESEKKPVFASDREKKKALLNGGQIYDSAPLSMEEEQLLKRLRNKRIGWTLFLGVIGGFVAFIILILVFLFAIYPAVKQFNLPRMVNIGIYWSIIAAVAGGIFFILFKRISPFQRDISEGRKNIVKTVITDKQRSNVKILSKNWKVTSSRGDFYYAVIDDVYREVTPEQFEKLQGGDPVKLHVAPHSGTFLKVEGI
ncbi:MAG: hypothetical protein V4642_04315 [Bacteroidota bacterium]